MALKFNTSGQRLVSRSAFKGSRPRPCIVRAPTTHHNRRTLVVRAGLFDFLTPKPAAPAVNPRAQEISEELIDICSGTAVGSKAAPAVKEQINELVAELAQYSIKNPLKSPLLWGTYEVLYCSKPTAVGGPLKKGAGPVIAAGQVARQILEEPDTLINEVTFKTFGFIPGISKQYGTIRPISGDTFVLSIKEGELNAGIVNQQREFDISRKIQILYLDDTLRIARFLPSDELADQESEEAQGGPESEEILFVFQRVAEEEEEAAEEEEGEPEPEEERAASPVLSLFGGGGTRKVESLATQVERQVESQRTRRGTQAFFVGGRGRDVAEEEETDDPRAAKQRERAEAQARKQREQDERRAAADRARQEAASAKAAEQARIQKERDAAAKAKAAQEARERAEAEKAERAARAAAIREQLAELAEELKEKQAAAREAQKEAREVARENQAILKQVQAAEKAIAEADQDVQEVSSALQEAVDARKSAETDMKQAQQAVKQAEAAYKQKVAAR